MTIDTTINVLYWRYGMKRALLTMLSFMMMAGCMSNGKVLQRNLLPINYVWLRVDSLEVKGSGQIKKIMGSVLSDEKEILAVDSLAENILCIQKKPDGMWQLPPNIFYKREEIVSGQVYKVIYEFSDTAPEGPVVITAYGR